MSVKTQRNEWSSRAVAEYCASIKKYRHAEANAIVFCMRDKVFRHIVKAGALMSALYLPFIIGWYDPLLPMRTQGLESVARLFVLGVGGLCVTCLILARRAQWHIDTLDVFTKLRFNEHTESFFYSAILQKHKELSAIYKDADFRVKWMRAPKNKHVQGAYVILEYSLCPWEDEPIWETALVVAHGKIVPPLHML